MNDYDGHIMTYNVINNICIYDFKEAPGVVCFDNKGAYSQRTLTMFVGVVALGYQHHTITMWC